VTGARAHSIPFTGETCPAPGTTAKNRQAVTYRLAVMPGAGYVSPVEGIPRSATAIIQLLGELHGFRRRVLAFSYIPLKSG
jgi:hypothetical protein